MSGLGIALPCCAQSKFTSNRAGQKKCSTASRHGQEPIPTSVSAKEWMHLTRQLPPAPRANKPEVQQGAGRQQASPTCKIRTGGRSGALLFFPYFQPAFQVG
jgi:hypothetical protein